MKQPDIPAESEAVKRERARLQNQRALGDLLSDIESEGAYLRSKKQPLNVVIIERLSD